MLEDASSSLDDQPELSNRAMLGLVECTILFSDLSIMSGAASAAEVTRLSSECDRFVLC